MGNGEWGLGTGDWGLVTASRSPVPIHQSRVPPPLVVRAPARGYRLRRDLRPGPRPPSPVATPLSDIAIQRELSRLPGWSRRGNALTKSYQFPSFLQGVAFVNRVADAAERANHHPDLDIRYTRIVCALSTHDAGGITQKDVALAMEIERLASEAGA